MRNRKLQRILQPLARDVVTNADLNHRRQTPEEGLGQLRVTQKKAANEAARSSATANVHQFQARFEYARQHRAHIDWRHSRTGTEHMPIAMRKRDEIAGR